MEATMAQRVTVELEDDIDGGPADQTLRFGLDGTEYEIGLSNHNARTFRRRIAPYLDHARKAGRGQRRRPGRTPSSRDRSGDIRAWAKDQGIPVSERGRIPASIVEQYEAATARA
jgi:nucleoid-associated protein Lsr2